MNTVFNVEEELRDYSSYLIRVIVYTLSYAPNNLPRPLFLLLPLSSTFISHISFWLSFRPCRRIYSLKNSCFKKTIIFKKTRYLFGPVSLRFIIYHVFYTIHWLLKRIFFIKTCVERVSRVKYQWSVIYWKGAGVFLFIKWCEPCSVCIVHKHFTKPPNENGLYDLTVF